MDKTKFKAYFIIITLIVFLISILSEVILQRALAGNYSFLGINRYIWINLHYHSHLLLFLLVLLHLVFHWEYIENLPEILKRK